MPSPFPGMNPYLEQTGAWHDFHEQFCIECRAQLVPKLTPKYIAKLDQHVYVHESGTETRRLLGRPDVAVAENRPRSDATHTVAATLPAPAVGWIETEIDVEHESFIEIRDAQSKRLVTVIELLSPANKLPGGDREQFLSKRRQILSSDVHLVEIDLLRGGPRMPIVDLPDSDYCVMVSRVDDRPQVGLWPISLRDALPEISVPLSENDESVNLDLQAAFQSAFTSAGYEAYIYEGTPDPTLRPDDAIWADELLQNVGQPDQ